MKPLTKEEIKFIKETGWTPTVQQTDEWERTIFNKEDPITQAIAYAKEKYNISLVDLYYKCINEYDYITLENDAVYLFYIFFTEKELLKLTDDAATKWLKDFKYHCGYRKWDGGNLGYVNDAIAVYNNEAFFYTDKEGNVWYFDEEPCENYKKLEMEK